MDASRRRVQNVVGCGLFGIHSGSYPWNRSTPTPPSLSQSILHINHFTTSSPSFKYPSLAVLGFSTHYQFSSMATTSSQPILRSERPDTAVDSLKHLIANIPDWRKRLNELNSMASPQFHQKIKN